MKRVIALICAVVTLGVGANLFFNTTSLPSNLLIGSANAQETADVDTSNNSWPKQQKNKFEKFKGVNNKGQIFPIALYCSALYLQLELLSSKYDMSTAKTKAGGISGISNNGFTKKDFMSRYTTGDKKKIWGNPYIHEEFVKGEGKTKHLMTKASGSLDIMININRSKAKEIKTLIDNAGVSSFYLGKKGLAYVSKISTKEES